MPFEIFDHGPMRVTIASRNQVILNSRAMRFFKHRGFRRVLLLWDAEARQVAIRPAENGTDPRSFTIYYAQHNATIWAPAFVDHIHGGRGRYPAEWNEAEQRLEVALDRETVKSKEHRQ